MDARIGGGFSVNDGLRTAAAIHYVCTVCVSHIIKNASYKYLNILTHICSKIRVHISCRATVRCFPTWQLGTSIGSTSKFTYYGNNGRFLRYYTLFDPMRPSLANPTTACTVNIMCGARSRLNVSIDSPADDWKDWVRPYFSSE